jgi:hypothetical protein
MIGRIGRFLLRHILGTWVAICFAPLVFCVGLDEGEAADTYQIGAITLLFVVPTLVLPLAIISEWFCRNLKRKRTAAFLSCAAIPAVVCIPGAALRKGDTAFAGQVLLASVIIYWLTSNGIDLLLLRAGSRIARLMKRKGNIPHQTSEATQDSAPVNLGRMSRSYSSPPRRRHAPMVDLAILDELTICTELCTLLYKLESDYDDCDVNRVQEPCIRNAEPGGTWRIAAGAQAWPAHRGSDTHCESEQGGAFVEKARPAPFCERERPFGSYFSGARS